MTQTPARDGQQHAPPLGYQQPAPGHPAAPKKKHRLRTFIGPVSGTDLRVDEASPADHAQSHEGDSVARATAAHSRPIPTSSQEITETCRPEPRRFAIGDHVVAKDGIGLFRPRVPHGMSGVVAAFAPDGELEVQFTNGRVELLDPHRLIAA